MTSEDDERLKMYASSLGPASVTRRGTVFFFLCLIGIALAGWWACTHATSRPPLPNSLTVRVLDPDNSPAWAHVSISQTSDSPPFEVAMAHMDGTCEFRNVPYESVIIKAEEGGLTASCWYTPHGGAEFAATLYLTRSPP